MKLVPYTYNGTAINDGTNYAATIQGTGGLLPPHATPKYVNRNFGQYPLYGGKSLQGGSITLQINIKNTVDTRLQTLKGLFDTGDTTLRTLVCRDSDDNNEEWYIQTTPIDWSGQGSIFNVVLSVSDPVWKQVTAETETLWTVTASGQTKVVTIDKGNLSVYPVYTVTPQASSGSYYAHRRWVPVYNPSTTRAMPGPINLCQSGASTHVLDTAALVTAGKMQADGDDFIATIDRAPLYTWLDGINTTSTKLWANIPTLRPSIEGELQTAIGGTGDVTEIVLLGVDNALRLPDQDEYLLYVESELFIAQTAYRRKVAGEWALVFEDIDRAQNDTSMAAHSAGVTGRVLDYEIMVYYGKASATRPAYRVTTNDKYNQRPMFNLSTSTNYSWDYDDFRDNSNKRSARWRYGGALGPQGQNIYTATQGAYADPNSVMGLRVKAAYAGVFWELSHPAITAANFANGEKYNNILSNNETAFRGGRIQYRGEDNVWVTDYAIPAASVADTWETWSRNMTGITANAVRMSLDNRAAKPNITAGLIGVADVTVTLDSALVPVVRMQAEVSNAYTFNDTLENTTTGDSLTLTGVSDTGDAIVIDTLNKTVRQGNKNMFAMLTLNSVRDSWLELQQGSNTLTYTASGVTDNDIEISWQGRNN